MSGGPWSVPVIFGIDPGLRLDGRSSGRVIVLQGRGRLAEATLLGIGGSAGTGARTTDPRQWPHAVREPAPDVDLCEPGASAKNFEKILKNVLTGAGHCGLMHPQTSQPLSLTHTTQRQIPEAIMFTLENTSGFTKNDLELMNSALQELVARGMDEKNAADRVNNNWQETGNSVETLTKK